MLLVDAVGRSAHFGINGALSLHSRPNPTSQSYHACRAFPPSAQLNFSMKMFIPLRVELNMAFFQQRMETWIRDQRAKFLKVQWPQMQWRIMKWPWSNNAEQEKEIRQECERRKKQLQDLCNLVKTESLADLRDVLCCMVLSECVYKPASEVVRAVNKFKADFGGHIISLERIQPSSNHVSHRYLLAEAGDTLYASFVGTKEYKDVMADANILQGAIFHEDSLHNEYGRTVVNEKECIDNVGKHLDGKNKQKPAAHRGFLSRAKGIPALELYRLAQKKKQNLVLCGHSLGGAVAVLATLTILRFASASNHAKGAKNVQIKCITFSQPPVGNGALRDYVIEKGWQNNFKTYCIPEDVVPRILSPAYFHHYNAQPFPALGDIGSASLSMSGHMGGLDKSMIVGKVVKNGGKPLAFGFDPVQSSLWRLSKLVPLEGIKRRFGRPSTHCDADGSSLSEFGAKNDIAGELQSTKVQEHSDNISFCTEIKGVSSAITREKVQQKRNIFNIDRNLWTRMPYLPSYVPFGQLYLLRDASVELLSKSEYSELISVKSVVTELRERFQSHSMKSYRARFQRIYDMCIIDDKSPSLLGAEHFPHLQQWLGLSVSGVVELGNIVDPPVIHAATSLVPLGWCGIPGRKNIEPLKVDITGIGLHLSTLIQAQVNGNWCSTVVESFPSVSNDLSNDGPELGLQTMRVLVGPPLRKQPKYPTPENNMMCDLNCNDPLCEESFACPEGLKDFKIYCTTDFSTVSKRVHLRTRRVQLVGLEGAGKTSLFKAILEQGGLGTSTRNSMLDSEGDVKDGVTCGVCYADSEGVNLQDLNGEVQSFRNLLWNGMCDPNKKVDLVVLVHNLSHKVPRYNYFNSARERPALFLLLDEAEAIGVPWVLAITNKFSVSAHMQKAAIDSVLQAYGATSDTGEVVNTCPYVMPDAIGASFSVGIQNENTVGKVNSQHLSPVNFVQWPFQKKATVLPVEGVHELCHLVHRMLRSKEESTLEEFAKHRLAEELGQGQEASSYSKIRSQANGSSFSAAAVGASLGAGLGMVMAVVMGASSASRKP